MSNWLKRWFGKSIEEQQLPAAEMTREQSCSTIAASRCKDIQGVSQIVESLLEGAYEALEDDLEKKLTQDMRQKIRAGLGKRIEDHVTQEYGHFIAKIYLNDVSRDLTDLELQTVAAYPTHPPNFSKAHKKFAVREKKAVSTIRNEIVNRLMDTAEKVLKTSLADENVIHEIGDIVYGRK